MNIQSEIRDYIHSNDFVMLPGIGAFLAEYSKPFIDEYGSLVPATRSIRFNALLRNDSNVEILEVFKNKLGVNTEQVQAIYFDFLETIETSIDKTGSFKWPGLGMLLKGNDGELNFLEERQERPQIFNSLEVNQQAELVVDKPFKELETEVKDNKSGGSTLGRILVFALPLLLLTLALIYTVFIKPGIDKDLKEEAFVENADFDLEDSAEFEVDTLFSEPSSVRAENPVKQEPLGIEKEHIIKVGLYKTQGDADLIATLLAERGYPARVRPYGKLFKVYIVARDEEQVKKFIAEVTAIDELGVTPIYEK